MLRRWVQGTRHIRVQWLTSIYCYPSIILSIINNRRLSLESLNLFRKTVEWIWSEIKKLKRKQKCRKSVVRKFDCRVDNYTTQCQCVQRLPSQCYSPLLDWLQFFRLNSKCSTKLLTVRRNKASVLKSYVIVGLNWQPKVFCFRYHRKLFASHDLRAIFLIFITTSDNWKYSVLLTRLDSIEYNLTPATWSPEICFWTLWP